jgi:ketosteroid isomerase-like protein
MPAQIAFRVVGSFIAALTVAMSLQGCSAAPQSGADQRPDVVAALSAQADAWDKAIVRKDRRAIEVNMADDFRQIDGNGNVETRQSFVDDLVSPDLEIDPYTVEDFDVRLYGDVALLSGPTRMSGRYQGKPFSATTGTSTYTCDTLASGKSSVFKSPGCAPRRTEACIESDLGARLLDRCRKSPFANASRHQLSRVVTPLR